MTKVCAVAKALTHAKVVVHLVLFAGMKEHDLPPSTHLKAVIGYTSLNQRSHSLKFYCKFLYQSIYNVSLDNLVGRQYRMPPQFEVILDQISDLDTEPKKKALNLLVEYTYLVKKYFM